MVSHDPLASQSANPAIAQFGVLPQPPLTHTALRPDGGMHGARHRPQLATLVLRFTSQPLVGSVSQSSKPVLHTLMRHCPPTHALVALSS